MQADLSLHWGHCHFVGFDMLQLSCNFNVSSGFDALRNVIDHKTQKELGVSRPLLQVGSMFSLSSFLLMSVCNDINFKIKFIII